MSTTFSKRDHNDAKAVVVAAKGFATPVQGAVKLEDLERIGNSKHMFGQIRLGRGFAGA